MEWTKEQQKVIDFRGGNLLEKLRQAFGEKNVKVVEKAIEK